MPTKKGKWKCAACNKQKQEKDPSVECNLCNEVVGTECSIYTKEAIEYLNSQNIEITFICKSCKEKIPDLRNMLDIAKNQQQLKEEIDAHDTRITKCEVDLSEFNTKQHADNELLKQINIRLGDIEAKAISSDRVQTIAETCFKKAEFPSIKEAERKQLATSRKLEETLESQVELKLRADKEKSLIVFGIPEQPDAPEGDKMKSDFLTIRNLYSERALLECTDLTQIIRIGTMKPNQTRPIKITFHSMQKRQEILRNNRSLILSGDEFEECSDTNCAEVGEKHKHIYVSTDKTKKQIAEEKALRETLKARRLQDPDLVIRNGKIVNKTTLHARWSEIRNDF